MSFFIRNATRNLSSSSRISILAQSPRINYFQQTVNRGFKTTSVNMGVHNLATKAEFSSAITDNKIVVLDAFATWCGPCKAIAPQVVKFSEQFPGAHFVKVDVDEVPDVAQELGIRAMPTFVIFKDGEKVQDVVGANPKALLAAIESAVAA